MPLDDRYWNTLFGSVGIDPLAEDREDQFSNIMPDLYTGLDAREENPEAGIHSDPGFWGALGGRVVQTAAGVGSTLAGIGSTTADLFDKARMAQWELDAKGAEWLGDSAKAQEIREYGKYKDILGVAGAVSGGLKSAQGFMSDLRDVEAPPMDKGGSAISEIASDLGWGEDTFRPVELVKDVAGQLSTTAAGMASSVIAAGGVALPAMGQIGFGQALDVFQDTYRKNTENPTDSTLLAIATAGASAGAQGVLENIGWETALGKGAIADLFKAKEGASRLGSAAVRGLYSALTEGSEEALQQSVDILAKQLPDLQQKDLNGVWAGIQNDAIQQIPESAFGGALFGGVLGGATGMARLGVADTGSRHGNDPNVAPEQQIITAIDKGPSINDVVDTTVKLSESILDVPDLTDQGPQFDTEVDEGGPKWGDTVDEGGPTFRSKKKSLAHLDTGPSLGDKPRDTGPKFIDDALDRAAASADAINEAIDNALFENNQQRENDRAEIASTLKERDVNDIGDALKNHIAKSAEEEQQKVATLAEMWGTLSSMMQGNVQIDPEEEGGYTGEDAGISREEAVLTLVQQAEGMGIQLPDQAVNDPDSFDWAGFAEQRKNEVAQKTASTLAVVAAPIADAIDLEDGHPVKIIADMAEPPTVANVMPKRSDVLEAQQAREASRQEAARAGEDAHTAAPKIYMPNVSVMAQWDVDSSLNEIKDPLCEEWDSFQLNNKDNIYAYLDGKFGRDVVSANKKVDKLVGNLASLAAPGPKTKQTSERITKAIDAIESVLLTQITPTFNMDAPSPDIEATNMFTSAVPYVHDESFDSEMARVMEAHPNAKAAVVDAYAARAEAKRLTPFVKTALFALAQTAPKDLMDKVTIALSAKAGMDSDSQMLAARGLGAEVMQHLSKIGLFKVAAKRAAVDPQYANAIGRALVGVGKGVMTPWTVERALTSNGVSLEDARSTVSVLNAMADAHANATGNSTFNFWDRIADEIELMSWGDRDTAPAGLANVGSKLANSAIQRAMRGSKGFVKIYDKLYGGEAVHTVLHEMTHALYMSGLMWEILDLPGRAAMEEMAGEKLWRNDGEPLDISASAHEKIALGFEKFLYKNKAPNAKMARAFKTVRDFFRVAFYGWLKSTGLDSSMSSPDVADKLNAENPDLQSYQLYDNTELKGIKEKDKVKLNWGDVKVGAGQARAFYMILNANPDGTEYPLVSAGLAVAYENELAMNTGIPAKGVLTAPRMAQEPSKQEGDGWVWTDGVRPSEGQWRAMVGLTNDQSDGIDTQAALIEMDKNRELVGEMAKDVASKGHTAPSPAQKRNQDAQKVMEAEAPMLGSPSHDLVMDDIADQLIGGQKDVHFGGKIVNFFDKDHINSMLTNFASKLRVWRYDMQHRPGRTTLATIGGGFRGMLKGFFYPVIRLSQGYEKQFGNIAAGWEGILEDLAGPSAQELDRVVSALPYGATEEQKNSAIQAKKDEYSKMDMPSIGKMLNNFAAIGKLAEKIAEKAPQIWDADLRGWRDIPGGESFNSIMARFVQYADTFWEQNQDSLLRSYRDKWHFHEAIRRDMRLFMLATRQNELEMHAEKDQKDYKRRLDEWEKNEAVLKKKRSKDGEVAYVKVDHADKPTKPKGPKITKEGSNHAKMILALLGSRYGKDIAMFKDIGFALSSWENKMVLDKLLNAKMISQKEYDDLKGKGKWHVPMYRIKEAVERSGVRNIRWDDSVYKPLDYLKNDIAVKMEDPINAMLKRAKSVELLTHRQAAKNAIGERILANVKWWKTDHPDSKMGIFSKREEIDQDEWERLMKEGESNPYALSMKPVDPTKTHKTGDRTKPGYKYYKHIPLEAKEVEEGVAEIAKRMSARELAKKSIDGRLDWNVFAFFPEPGKAMYVIVEDPELARAFFYINNSQAFYATSWMAKLENQIANMNTDDVVSKAAHNMLKVMHTGYYKFNKVASSLITSNPAFIYNALFRDIPAAMTRSRHGMRLSDIITGFSDAAKLMYPTLLEWSPSPVVSDALKGSATFSGLAMANQHGELDADIIFELMRGRKNRSNTQVRSVGGAMLAGMWSDFEQFLAKEGINKNPSQIMSEIKRGKKVGQNLMLMAKAAPLVPKTMLQFFATVLENTPRMAERRLSMAEDMSQYPSLAGRYDPSKAVDGKIMAGFDGAMHRRAWEAAKKKLAVDPGFNVPESAMPMQFDFNERDYSMAHVTLQFAQKGAYTKNVNDAIMFFNPSAQDLYTNMKILTEHSLAKKAMAFAMGDKYVPTASQPKMDMQAERWLWKSFFYMTLPTIFTAMMYGTGDDDDSLEWQNQTFFEKMSYTWIPLNKMLPGLFKRPLRIANGLGIGTLMLHDLPLAAYLDLIEGSDKDAMRKWRDRFFESTPLGLIANPVRDTINHGAEAGVRTLAGSTLFAPEVPNAFFEMMTDHQKFGNRGIKQDESFDQREPAEIGSERHTMLVNYIARKLNFLNLQPAQVDYMIRRLTPGLAKTIPLAVNKAMEASTGSEGVPPDMRDTAGPFGPTTSGVLPKWQAKDNWGMGNEFVGWLLSTAREAQVKKNTYDEMVESRKEMYKADNPLISDDIFYGKRGENGVRSGGLLWASKYVIAKEKEKRALLKAGKITDLEASMIERGYTLIAHQAMTNVISQIEGE